MGERRNFETYDMSSKIKEVRSPFSPWEESSSRDMGPALSAAAAAAAGSVRSGPRPPHSAPSLPPASPLRPQTLAHRHAATGQADGKSCILSMVLSENATASYGL